MICPNCGNEIDVAFPSSAYRSYRVYLTELKEGEVPMDFDKFFDKFYYFDQ